MQKPPQIIAVVAAQDKSEALEFAPIIEGWLRERQCTVLTESELEDGTIADVLIALGGDGLMMHMAYRFPTVPIIGINFGTVGFLAMVERSRWREVLVMLLAGQYTYQDGPTLQVEARRNGDQSDHGTAINDVVIRSGIQMIDVELYIDGRYVNTYPGDGMIVSSPQGSTAYCMAAGGPILTAGVRGFAITPISAHSPIRATLVVPEESSIELVLSNNREGHLILDGKVAKALLLNDIVHVSAGRDPFRMIMIEGMNFYEAFRSKFNYLIRPDAVPSLGVDRNYVRRD
ncbi:NAD(+)/NADH kinase [soil metagenome]